MTSLSEVYGDGGRSTTSLRRLYLGVGLFVVGILLIVAGIVAAGTDLIPSMEAYSLADARWIGGILGGIGLPLAMLGVMSVLPAGRTTRAASIVGAAIMALGVALFSYAYPYHWINSPRPELVDLTLPTAGVYFLGAATTFWCLFVGVANFKTRNDPGGTVTLEVTHEGETRVVEVERSQLHGVGGVGLLGGTPDGSVETQTNDPDANRIGEEDVSVTTRSSGSASGSGPGGSLGTASVSDGGSEPERLSTPTGSGRDGGPDRESTTNRSSTSTRSSGAGSESHRSSTSERSSPDSDRRGRTEWPDPGPGGSASDRGSTVGNASLGTTDRDDEDTEFIE
ncbi:hypothetical protein ACERIT_00105 [Halopenitus sp. H-Gu1]|uniref:DUF7139 domain-containing protein n=1 Tax=Halopenitus sp. H-Gu1 TaxID=3242697 RepID=UPI00359D5F9C